MRVVAQRVDSAEVEVDGAPVAHIDGGLLCFVGIGRDDDREAVERMAEKLAGLRVFSDETGMMNLAVSDTGGSVLVVSQFTLYGDTAKGNRPSFIAAAPPSVAEPLVSALTESLRSKGLDVQEGVFGAMMRVKIVNVGPVTILLEI